MPIRDNGAADGPFLCIPCHSQLEKVSKLKTNLRFLTEDVEKKLKNTAARFNVAMAQSGIHVYLQFLLIIMIKICDNLDEPPLDETPSRK